MENTAFFLDGPAVTEDAPGIFFQPDKIEEPEGFVEPDPRWIHVNIKVPYPVPGMGVQAADDGDIVFLPKRNDCGDELTQSWFRIDVLGTVDGDQEISALRNAEVVKNHGFSDVVLVMADHFQDRVAGNENPVAVNSLADEICTAAFSVGKKDVAAMVNDPPVYFFGDTIVITAVSGFHVDHGNPHAFCNDCRKAAVGVPQQQEPVRPFFFEYLFSLNQDLGYLLPGCLTFNPEEIIRLADFQVLKKNITEFYDKSELHNTSRRWCWNIRNVIMKYCFIFIKQQV